MPAGGRGGGGAAHHLACSADSSLSSTPVIDGPLHGTEPLGRTLSALSLGASEDSLGAMLSLQQAAVTSNMATSWPLPSAWSSLPAQQAHHDSAALALLGSATASGIGATQPQHDAAMLAVLGHIQQQQQQMAAQRQLACLMQVRQGMRGSLQAVQRAGRRPVACPSCRCPLFAGPLTRRPSWPPAPRCLQADPSALLTPADQAALLAASAGARQPLLPLSLNLGQQGYPGAGAHTATAGCRSGLRL